MTETWRPYSRRIAGLGRPLPAEGLPSYLIRPIKAWLYQVLEDKPGPPMSMRPGRESNLTQEIMIRLELVGVRPWEIADNDEALIVDAVDAALRWTPWNDGDRLATPSELERILTAGNSNLCVSKRCDGLQLRTGA